MGQLLGHLVRSRITIMLAASMTATLGGRSARADPVSPPPPLPSDTATGLRERGNAAAEAGDIGDALTLWVDAWKRQPGDGSLACDIGRAWVVKGDFVEAARWLTRCVDLLLDTSTPDAIESRRSEVVDLSVAKARVTTLHVDIEPAAELYVNGISIGKAPLPEPTFVKPGQHRIDARKGDRVASVTLHTNAGETYRIPLTLPAAEPPPVEAPEPAAKPARPNVAHQSPRAAPPILWWPVALGGTVAAISAGMGVAFRLTAGEKASEAESLAAFIQVESHGVACGNEGFWSAKCEAYSRANAQHTVYTNASTAAFIVAGITAAGSIGFAAYQIDRIRIAPTIGGITGSYQW
jgi:hypothetical protein